MAIPIVNKELYKDADFDLPLQLGYWKAIVSITAATPAVVTVYNHGYSNGDTIIIAGSTNQGANGTWVIANKTTHTFELVGSTGTTAATQSGKSIKPNDLTGATIACKFKNQKINGTLIDPQPTLTIVNAALGSINVSYTPAQTNGLTVSNIFYDVRVTDTLGEVKYRCEGTIKVIPTITT